MAAGSYHTPIRRLGRPAHKARKSKLRLACLDGKPHIDSNFYLHIHSRGRLMTNTTMINYSTRDFATKEQLELYLLRQEKAFTPEVIKLFTDAGMLRRVVTQIWNKEHSFRVGIVFEYRDQDAYIACQALLEQHYLPAVEGLTTKVVGSRGVIVHEFVSDAFQD